MPTTDESVGRYAHLRPGVAIDESATKYRCPLFGYSWHPARPRCHAPLPRPHRGVPPIRRRPAPYRAQTMALRRGEAGHIGRKALPLGSYWRTLC